MGFQSCAPLAIMDDPRPRGIWEAEDEDDDPAADEGLLRQFLRATFLPFYFADCQPLGCPGRFV